MIRFVYSFVVLSLLFVVSSCRQVAKEVTEEVVEKASKTTAKSAARKAGKEVTEEIVEKGTRNFLRSASQETFFNLGYDGFLSQLKKDAVWLSRNFDEVGEKFGKEIYNEMCKSNSFRKSLLDNEFILSEFKNMTKDVPSLSKNIDFLKCYSSIREVNSSASKWVLKSNGGNEAKILTQEGGEVIAKVKSNVYTITDANYLKKNSAFSGELVPDKMHIARRKDGASFIFRADNYGRARTVKTTRIDAKDIESVVIGRTGDITLGKEWNEALRKIKTYSKGNDLDIDFRFVYSKDGKRAEAVVLESVKTSRGKTIDLPVRAFRNIAEKAVSKEDKQLIASLSSKLGLTDEMANKLGKEIANNDAFAKLIHSNPEFEISRWMKTINPVDKSLLAKTANGRAVPNGGTYAGNTFFFNPLLNKGLDARLKRGNGIVKLAVSRGDSKTLDRAALERLDKLYPNGVPYNKQGYPDFTGVARKDGAGNCIVLRLEKAPKREEDIPMLWEKLRKEQPENHKMLKELEAKGSYSTWHHEVGGDGKSVECILVPTDIHALANHAGGISESIVK